MQAFSRWTPPGGTLGLITEEARERAALLETRRAELVARIQDVPEAPSLAHALRAPTVSVLAEVKRSSPSKGSINPGLDPVVQARAYAAGGARGLSILTEPRHFGGSEEDLVQVRAATSLPILKKDFHVAPAQLLEARALGASAVLLIARALPPDLLPALAGEAHHLGLEVLIEIRDEEELERALATSAAMIGVNNRNLESLEIDLATSERLIPRIPADRIAIAESGVVSGREVERAAAVGADAVLVGSSISAAADPAAAVCVLTSVARKPR